MKKAFIFDMDGVIINSEQAWAPVEKKLLTGLIGEAITEQIGNTVGVGIEGIYKKAKDLGSPLTLEDFRTAYDKVAFKIYETAEITSGIEELVDFLAIHDFPIGIVSASPMDRVDILLSRLSFGNRIRKIISLDTHSKLRGKPSPDGYNEMMKILGSRPEGTIILEDSNLGIQAAKASGAFTIALSQNLVAGYKQKDADVYAVTPYDVIKLIKKHRKNLLI